MPAIGQQGLADQSPNTPWPFSITLQGAAIAPALTTYGVPAGVFMGMYNNETVLGTLRNSDGSIKGSPKGAIGPFQFVGSDKNTGVLYPLTSTPTLKEFQQQANAAAAYLKALFKQFGSWQNALAAYNGGPGNVTGSAEQAYASKALSFVIPADWQSALSGIGLNLGPAAPGGAANAGGTGALPNDALTSGFQVGDPTNPDEDYWTAINRIAQARYWYVFSDGESLYLADGPDLMRQTPALSVDRIIDSGNISSLDFTWDNTAWTYSVTHRKRRRIQRRTTLAKVTSPVEADLQYICEIDAVRAGDVIELSSCGPGDEKWLVGDCRRSVFEVSSEINLVMALTPLTEDALNPAGINQKNILQQYGPGVGVGNIKGYFNPVSDWNPSRIDMGVDGTLNGNYLAPGDSVIVVAEVSDSGWKGGGYIAGRFTSGSLAGKVWYVAEGVTPTVPQNAVVKAGTPVARPTVNPYNGIVGNIETGWAAPSSTREPLARTLPGYSGDQSPQAIACGNSFNRFITKLGARPGAVHDKGVGVVPAAMPGGYP